MEHTSIDDLQPHALLELTQPVKVEFLSAEPVPASWSWLGTLPAGVRVRVAWNHYPGDRLIHTSPDEDRDRALIEATFQGTEEEGTQRYAIQIMPADLEGAFTVIENKRWQPEDIDLSQAGHVRLLVRHVEADPVWLRAFPPAIRTEIEEVMEQWRMGLITGAEQKTVDQHDVPLS